MKMMMRRSLMRQRTQRDIFVRLLSLVFLSMLSVCASAQSGSGSIGGTVQDANGAVIPNVAVHVVNKATGVYVDLKTNESGVYSAQDLFTGTYDLTFTFTGMKSSKSTLELQAAQNAVLNAKLDVGNASDTVTVDADTIQLATLDSPTVASTIDNERLNELPVNGRLLLTFAGLAVPGLESGGTRANGNLGEALEYVQDGAPLTNRNFGGEGNSTQAQLPDPDSIQEVRIETLNSSAQFATPATGIITSKSGTNALHGTLFETARNNAIGIAKSRANPPNFSAPHYVRNEFGASLGGPIIIPKLYNGKDRTFFFAAYERFSLRSFMSENVTVPMAAWHTGNFAGLTDSNGNPVTLYDPNTTAPSTNCNNTGIVNSYCRQPFAGNQIPIARQSPFDQKLLAITPLPTNGANPAIAPNLNVPAINDMTVPQVNFRVDHLINQNNHLFARASVIEQTFFQFRNYPSNSPATVAGAGFPAGAEGLQNIPIMTISGAIGYTHTFSSSFVSETNVAQEWFNQQVQGGNYVTLNDEQSLGLPNNFGEVGFPSITGTSSLYGGTQYNYGISQIITNVDENLTKIFRTHQFVFGGRYRHERFGYLPDRLPDTVAFGGFATAEADPTSAVFNPLALTGSGDADAFLGAAASYSVQLNAPYQHYRDQEIDSYFQDNWHATKRLTVNLGLRWEIHPAAEVHDGVVESFDLRNKAIVLQNPLQFYIDKGYTTKAIITNLTNLGVKFETPQAAGLPTALRYNYDHEFSPRLGLAYAFDGKYGTVFRGGYGRYIYPTPIRNSLKISAPNVPFAANYTQNYNNSAQTDGLNNYLVRNPQTIIAGQNSSTVVNTSSINAILPGPSTLLQTLDPHYGPAHVSETSFTIEQPLPHNTVLRATYLLDQGSNLDQNNSYNFHPSPYVYEVTTGLLAPTANSGEATGPYDQTTYGQSVISQKTGYSNDNALQINFQRLYKNGYGFQIYEVYSKAFRVGGNSFRDSVIYPAADYAPGVLPSTDFDALNRFENYQVDSAVPRHHIGFNGTVDIPIGRGKRFFGNTNRLVNELIGGFQLAGTGQVLTQWFQVANTNFGATNPLQTYRNGPLVNDCRSGVCYQEKLWFNGYINPKFINAATNGISGLPSGYAPYSAPTDNNPNAPAGSFAAVNFGTNNVPVTLANGSVQTVSLSPGPTGANPFSHTFLEGPINYNADLSLFKAFPITEKVNFRVNVDAFNAFNIQGTPNPNTTDGTISRLVSYWTSRQIQITARLTF